MVKLPLGLLKSWLGEQTMSDGFQTHQNKSLYFGFSLKGISGLYIDLVLRQDLRKPQ